MSFRSGLIKVGRVTRRPHIPRSAVNVWRVQLPIVCQSKFIANVSYHDREIFGRVEDSLREFIASVTAKNLADIHQRYPALVHDLNSAQGVTTSSSLTVTHLNDVFDALGASARIQDIELMNKIISEMHTLFGVEPTIETHTIIVRSFIRSGHHSTAYNWIRNIPRKPPHIKPSMQLWHSYLETWLQRDDTHLALSGLLKEIRRTGCRPLSTTYELLIQACRKGAPLTLPLDYFDVLMKDMQKYSAAYSPSVATHFRRFYAENGQKEDGVEVARRYESHSHRESPEDHWCQILSDKAYDIGTRGALRFFISELEPAGCQASAQIFKALLRHSKSLGDLWHLEKSLGITADPTHWAIVIRNVALAGNIPAALEIYEESKKAGIRPNSALVDPLIRGLCTHRISPPTDSDIDTALRIYHDLLAAEAEGFKQTSSRESTISSGPDIKVYQNLIRALSSSTKILKYSPTVKSLIEDMQSRQIFTDDSETTTSIIILLMRLSTNFNQAFAAYRRFNSSLDEKGYNAVLAAFCKLSFEGESHLPSLSQYFDIVDDMRQAGHPLSVRVYTVFLGQLARLVDERPELQMELVQSARQTHDMLTLDASVSPDAHVWNQLMDTYQRLGCFADAYRVWDLMYLSGRFDHASVSIILDACGYAMAWPIAKSITGKLFAESFKFNLNNWNTWLECLCRLGRLEDAVKTACLIMPKEGVEPNTDSIRTLMFCAHAQGQRSAVGARIRLFLPKLWKKLPKELQ